MGVKLVRKAGLQMNYPTALFFLSDVPFETRVVRPSVRQRCLGRKANSMRCLFEFACLITFDEGLGGKLVGL